MIRHKQLKIDKNIIRHLIAAQAGSIEKAILELVMNSYDAGATRIDVILHHNGECIEVIDNGTGFNSEQEIDDCFGTFGFDHNTDEQLAKGRRVGQFGLGRGQAWNYAWVKYETNRFELAVDIRERGLEYSITTSEFVLHKGCRVYANLYERISSIELLQIERHLGSMLRYLAVPVHVNDTLVSCQGQQVKWTHDTDTALVRLDSRTQLDIFNMGIFVCSIPRNRYGVGGVVTSKQAMKLNMARNDILRAECDVWKSVSKLITAESTRVRRARVSLTDDDRSSLIKLWLSGDYDSAQEGKSFYDQKVLKDIKGRYTSFATLLRSANEKIVVTIAPGDQSQIGERINQYPSHIVLSPAVLDWFGAWDIDSLRDCLLGQLERLQTKSRSWHAKTLIAALVFIPFDSLAKEFSTHIRPVEKKSLSDNERDALKAIIDTIPRIGYIEWSSRSSDASELLPRRMVVIGECEFSHMWTDGLTYIGIDRKELQLINEGMSGAQRIVMALIHEYLHNEASTAHTHIHGVEFYERYHDITLQFHAEILAASRCMVRHYERSLRRRGVKITKRLVDGLIESSEQFDNAYL